MGVQRTRYKNDKNGHEPSARSQEPGHRTPESVNTVSYYGQLYIWGFFRIPDYLISVQVLRCFANDLTILDFGYWILDAGGHGETLKSREQRENCRAGLAYSGIAGVKKSTLFFTVIGMVSHAEYSVQLVESELNIQHAVLNGFY